MYKFFSALAVMKQRSNGPMIFIGVTGKPVVF
jgi:hypothetical protein